MTPPAPPTPPPEAAGPALCPRCGTPSVSPTPAVSRLFSPAELIAYSDGTLQVWLNRIGDELAGRGYTVSLGVGMRPDPAAARARR